MEWSPSWIRGTAFLPFCVLINKHVFFPKKFQGRITLLVVVVVAAVVWCLDGITEEDEGCFVLCSSSTTSSSSSSVVVTVVKVVLIVVIDSCSSSGFLLFSLSVSDTMITSLSENIDEDTIDATNVHAKHCWIRVLLFVVSFDDTILDTNKNNDPNVEIQHKLIHHMFLIDSTLPCCIIHNNAITLNINAQPIEL